MSCFVIAVVIFGSRWRQIKPGRIHYNLVILTYLVTYIGPSPESRQTVQLPLFDSQTLWLVHTAKADSSKLGRESRRNKTVLSAVWTSHYRLGHSRTDGTPMTNDSVVKRYLFQSTPGNNFVSQTYSQPSQLDEIFSGSAAVTIQCFIIIWSYKNQYTTEDYDRFIYKSVVFWLALLQILLRRCRRHIFTAGDRLSWGDILMTLVIRAPCGLRGCRNRAHSVSCMKLYSSMVSWPEVVKGVSNQGVYCFVS